MCDTNDEGDSVREIASQEDQVSWTEEITIRSRTYFSFQHIQSAAIFARLAAAIERQWQQDASQQLTTQQWAYVTGAIFTTVSFLEALINEFFMDAVDNAEGHVKGLGEDVINHLADSWRRGVPRRGRYSVTDKYQIALDLCGQKRFNKGEAPFQDVAILLALRNELVHYEPVWLTTLSTRTPGEVQRHSLEANLRGKFAISPLPSSGLLQYLAYGCAQWAVMSSLCFADAFFERLGLPAPYAHIRHNLVVE